MSAAIAITYLIEMEIFPFKQQEVCLGQDTREWSCLFVPFIFINFLDLEKLVESRAWSKTSPLNGPRETPQTQSSSGSPEKELSLFKATCVLFLLNL